MERGRFASWLPGRRGRGVAQEGLVIGVTGLISVCEHLVHVPSSVSRVEPLLVSASDPFPERLRFVRIVGVHVGRVRRGALVSQRFLVEAIKVKGNLEAEMLLGGKVAQKLEVLDTVLARAVSQNVIDPRGT